MKTTRKILLGSLILIGLQFAWTGCVVPVGGAGVIYGGNPWFQDDVWLDGGGRGWYGGNGGGAYVHPNGGNRGGGGGHR
jgi:hypothetical protein